MKNRILLLLFAILFIGNTSAQTTKTFIFGHSLLDHRPPAIATPSNENSVPHWIYLLAQQAGYDYAAGGQYGFLPQHANVPPISQWGYDIVPGVWESDTEPFSDADIDNVIITAGNFMQWQAPDLEYSSDPGITPISATETVIDWVNTQEPTAKLYIYENWPDMAEYLGTGFPPTTTEFANYNQYLENDFHDWWIEYQDALLQSRPDMNIRMIPVGPIISNILNEVLSNPIPMTELYEDDAPHGRPTIYFLASLVTYMAIFQEKAPSYNVPSIIHEEVSTNYDLIVENMWQQLTDFNLSNGESRVFFDKIDSNINITSMEQNIIPNPTTGSFKIDNLNGNYTTIEISTTNGRIVKEAFHYSRNQSIDISNLPKGVYFIKIQSLDVEHSVFKRIVIL